MSSILIVEDEAGIASFLEKGLRGEGHTTSVVTDGPSALAAALGGEFDLVLLDLGLPLLDGTKVLRSLRAAGSDVPVIVLTARSGLEDVVAGLEGGADDYVAKPFRFRELSARIQVQLRSRAAAPGAAARLAHGTVALDLHTRRAEVAGRSVELTAREFTLAEVFLRNPGRVLSREQLLNRVWGLDHEPGTNVVDVYVSYLRRKLGADVIETVRGMGYRLKPE